MRLPGTLKELGLSEKEAEVYLALLSSGLSTTTQLAKKTNLNRSTIYNVLGSLENRQLVSIEEKFGVKKYQSVSPEKLANIAISMVKDSSQKEELINELLPKLRNIYKGTKKRPSVQIFEGKEGLVSAFEDTLNNSNYTFRVISDAGNIYPVLPSYLSSYIEKRLQKNIKMKGIHPTTYANKQMKEQTPGVGIDEMRFIPQEKYKFSSNFSIYQDKVGFMSPKNLLSVHIRSEKIAEVAREMFDLAFEEAKRLSKQEEVQ